jgi:hypothetical protein
LPNSRAKGVKKVSGAGLMAALLEKVFRLKNSMLL